MENKMSWIDWWCLAVLGSFFVMVYLMWTAPNDLTEGGVSDEAYDEEGW